MWNRQRCGHWERSCSAWSPAFSPRAAISVWWTLISGPSQASPMVFRSLFQQIVIRQNSFLKEVHMDNPGMFLILQLRKSEVKGKNQTSLYIFLDRMLPFGPSMSEERPENRLHTSCNCIIGNCVSGLPVSHRGQGQPCVWRVDMGDPSIPPYQRGRPWYRLAPWPEAVVLASCGTTCRDV